MKRSGSVAGLVLKLKGILGFWIRIGFMWILHFCMFATNELIANAILILIQHFRFLNKDWVYVDIALLYVCHQWVDCQCYTNINSTF